MANINDPNRDIGVNRADINTGTTGSASDIDWGTEDTYWRQNFSSRPYVNADRGYDFYRPAYRFGTESASRYHNRAFEDVEPDLSRGWNEFRGQSNTAWENVKDAVRDAWDRVRGRR